MLVTAILMICTVRYYSFKELPFKMSPRFALLFAAMLLGGIYFYSEEVLLVMAVIYISSGPVAKLLPIARATRRMLIGGVPESEHAHGNIKT